MALPPDPIDEILPLAQVVALAEVSSILFRDQQEFVPNSKDPYEVDIPRDLPLQRVSLKVEQLLDGDRLSVGQSIEAIKPAGEYVLRAGVKGPFLLQWKEGEDKPFILGMYGPDTYSQRVLEAALKAHGRRS